MDDALEQLALDAETEQRLLAMKRQLLSRLEQTHKDIHGREERVSADFAEQSVELESRDLTILLDAEARRELRRIEGALQRLATGVYGRCRHCGKAIDQGRLRAIPTAESCIGCASKGLN